ncbi:MAG TPA: transcription termination factor Rho [Actinoplanes sp.]
MSDTTDVTSGVSDVADDGTTTATATRRRRGGTGLSAMLLPELQSLAASLGISGTARMRKGELIAAITERQGGSHQAAAAAPPPVSRAEPAAVAEPAAPAAADTRPVETPAETVQPDAGPRTERTDRPERGGRDRQRNQRGDGVDQRDRNDQRDRSDQRDRNDQRDRSDQRDRNDQRDQRDDRPDRGDRNDQRDRGPRNDRDDDDGDNGDGGRRSRRSRFRDRRRGRGDRDSGDGQRDGGRDGREPHVNEDDVLVPVAGIVDVLDNYAFVRTTGYLSGPNDVYVSMSQVKKHGLRRGDAVTGAVRATNRDNDQRRDKYNPLIRLDTINGMDPEEARRRPEFYKLTPLYPQERLRLESEPHILTTRVIDLVMPIGKGQRALIVSPPKAGKTMVLQALANAITHNNPECHLMVVLVDERPEEVTDMQRSVKGEVIAATFDRPPQDHTTVAELAIERAKRLVELGHDVVVLLDSVTRLGRSYNLAAPASGRIMSGGIDSTALYPPKRFLGAARNIENGGSLTILATALVETGSMMDTVIFEEFKGTGNAELKLDRKIADKRTFPAVDVSASGTRKEEILLGKEELAIVHKLRKVLASLEASAALDLLLDRLKQTRTNIEFLMQIAKSTPGE